MARCYNKLCDVRDRPGKNVYGFQLVEKIPYTHVGKYESEEFVRCRYDLRPSRVYAGYREHERDVHDLWDPRENVPVEVKWVNRNIERGSTGNHVGFHFHGSHRQHRSLARARGYYYVVRSVLKRPYAKVFSKYDTYVYRRKYNPI